MNGANCLLVGQVAFDRYVASIDDQMFAIMGSYAILNQFSVKRNKQDRTLQG